VRIAAQPFCIAKIRVMSCHDQRVVGPPELTGPRVRLVPCTPEHHARLREIHLEPEVRRWWQDPADDFPANMKRSTNYTVVLDRQVIEEDSMLYALFGWLHAAAARRARAITIALEGQRGQGTVEYVGLILLVSLLMVGMVAAMKGFNEPRL
jgi:hypothetical protein